MGIVENSIHNSVTVLHSVLHLDDVGMPMIILMTQIRPQLLYSVTNYIAKHIKFIGNLYYKSQMVPTLWVDWHK